MAGAPSRTRRVDSARQQPNGRRSNPIVQGAGGDRVNICDHSCSMRRKRVTLPSASRTSTSRFCPPAGRDQSLLEAVVECRMRTVALALAATAAEGDGRPGFGAAWGAATAARASRRIISPDVAEPNLTATCA